MKTFALWMHIPATGERVRLTEIMALDIVTAQQQIAAQLQNEEPYVCPSIEMGNKRDSVATIRWRSVELNIIDEEKVRQEAALVGVLLKLPRE